MANIEEPYVAFMPGDLIAAETMNDMQRKIRDDIGVQSKAAADAKETIGHADNADALQGQSLEALTRTIVEKAIAEMARESGYRRLFKKLTFYEAAPDIRVIRHDLQNCPLVDLYQLEYFQVVASEDGYNRLTWVNFFIYHSSEKRIRYVPEEQNQKAQNIEIESSKQPNFRIPLRDLLAWYNVDYDDDSSLGDIETEFWDKLFGEPNDRFDDDQYAHSPWFDRCCRDERTVRSLKQKDDWNEIWIKIMPRKTVNFHTAALDDTDPPTEGPRPQPAPTQVQVCHLDLNSIALGLLRQPVYSTEVADALRAEDRGDALDELKLMVLLRA